MKATIALRLSLMSPEQKINFVTLVISALTSHAPTFPTPNPPLAGLTAAKGNLSTRLTSIGTMASNLDAEKLGAVSSEQGLDDLIVQLATYVENIAKGDPEVILLSGFDLAQEPTPIGELPPPENLRTSATDIEGQLRLKWGAVRGAKSYIVECAQSANGPWTQVTVTARANHSVDGLTAGTKYWFRVRAVGAAGMSGWSDPAVKMAA